MTSEEHLKILIQGVEIWNRWREENPDIKPDLRRVELRKSDPRGVDFVRVDLSSTDL